MRAYRCDLNAIDSKFCFVSHHISPFDGPMAEGTPLVPVLKRKNVNRVDLDLDEDCGGLDLPDLVANVLNYLVMSNAVMTAIEAHFELGPHDKAPVALMDKKKKVHSADYMVVNPHGQIECLDLNRSELDGDPEEPFVRIFGKWALKADAVPTDRDIFRVKGLASGYIFSERLADFIRAQNYTNFELTDVTL